MKLILVNGESEINECVTININEYMNVEDIKFKFDDFQKGDGHFTKSHFTLIYKDIILSDGHCIKHYKLQNNCKIWIGKLENYLNYLIERDEDVLIEMFIAGIIPDWMWVIVHRNDKIRKIREITSERVYPNILDIWNTKGDLMGDDKYISSIDKSGYYKLIVSCDDGLASENDDKFDKYREIHDQYWIKRYLFWDVIRYNNDNEIIQGKLIELIYCLKEIIISKATNDTRLRLNLSALSSSFVNSRTFRDDMVARINDICEDYWSLEKRNFESEIIKIFDHYFFWAIHTSLWDYAKYRRCNDNKENKLITGIIIDTLEYYLKYLKIDNNNWLYWMRLYLNQRLLKALNSSDLNESIKRFDDNKLSINIRMNDNNYQIYIQRKPETILQVKNALSYRTGVGAQQLYIIKPGGDYKPKDDDLFDEEDIIEIVLGINDIEILGLISQGGFGYSILIKDKLSLDEYILKKQKTHIDLYRDISIQHKMRKCKSIMSYWRLIYFEGDICIASKYMSKGSLKSQIQKEALSEKVILKIIYQVLLQIKEMHKENVIHRDINCDNIVLDDHNNAILIDFGWAKYCEKLSDDKQLEKMKAYKPGTAYYMAPELLNSELYSNKVDIWSLGATIIEMITRKKPYPHLKSFQVIIKIAKIKKIEFEAPDTISKDLIELIDLCLDSNKLQRPSAEELLKLPILKNIGIME